MASRDLNLAHEVLRTQFTTAKIAFEKNNPTVKVVVTCTYRPAEEQNKLYNQPWDKKDNDGDGKVDESDEKVTQAKGGQSPHNYNPSYAIDVAFINNGKTDWSEKWFKAFAPYMANPKIEWGGLWRSMPDMPHYELKGWRNLKK